MTSRELWYQWFDHIFSPSPRSGLDCLSTCQALCCPRDDAPEPKVGLFIVYLPYELEYIAASAGIDLSGLGFNEQGITLPSGERVIIPWTRNCPFIRGTSCSIYSARPWDCRSFPLSPYRSNGHLELRVDTDCLAHQHVSEAHRSYVTNVWEMIYPSVPPDWWALLQEIREFRA